MSNRPIADDFQNFFDNVDIEIATEQLDWLVDEYCRSHKVANRDAVADVAFEAWCREVEPKPDDREPTVNKVFRKAKRHTADDELKAAIEAVIEESGD